MNMALKSTIAELRAGAERHGIQMDGESGMTTGWWHLKLPGDGGGVVFVNLNKVLDKIAEFPLQAGEDEPIDWFETMACEISTSTSGA